MKPERRPLNVTRPQKCSAKTGLKNGAIPNAVASLSILVHPEMPLAYCIYKGISGQLENSFASNYLPPGARSILFPQSLTATEGWPELGRDFTRLFTPNASARKSVIDAMVTTVFTRRNLLHCVWPNSTISQNLRRLGKYKSRGHSYK